MSVSMKLRSTRIDLIVLEKSLLKYMHMTSLLSSVYIYILENMVFQFKLKLNYCQRLKMTCVMNTKLISYEGLCVWCVSICVWTTTTTKRYKYQTSFKISGLIVNLNLIVRYLIMLLQQQNQPHTRQIHDSHLLRIWRCFLSISTVQLRNIQPLQEVRSYSETTATYVNSMSWEPRRKN